MDMRVVVTGGAGFLGSHLCERLVADGCEVVCLDDLSTGAAGNVAHLVESGSFRAHHGVRSPQAQRVALRAAS
jgi:nucleoside-diphosphate-sugar epimerase